jgi:predicted aspartyl protease
MVDTGARYSVLNKAHRPLNKERTSVVQGATGTQLCSWTTKRKVDLGKYQVTHSFLVVPESPAPLLGRDLLTKIGAHIHFEPDKVIVTN